jgi:hypothetical protein
VRDPGPDSGPLGWGHRRSGGPEAPGDTGWNAWPGRVGGPFPAPGCGRPRWTARPGQGWRLHSAVGGPGWGAWRTQEGPWAAGGGGGAEVGVARGGKWRTRPLLSPQDSPVQGPGEDSSLRGRGHPSNPSSLQTGLEPPTLPAQCCGHFSKAIGPPQIESCLPMSSSQGDKDCVHLISSAFLPFRSLLPSGLFTTIVARCDLLRVGVGQDLG